MRQSSKSTKFLKNWRPKTVGIVIKHHDPAARLLAVQIAKFLLARKVGVVLPADRKQLIKVIKRESEASKSLLANKLKWVTKPQMPERCNLIIVLGGDGTFLSIARHMRKKSVPLMGINMGRVGFLTEIKKEESLSVLEQIFKNKKLSISARSMLDVRLIRNNKAIYSGPVVNDAVISKGAIARIMSMQVSVNSKWANNVRADGLIFSTPTGSTAYNLAAGGPILDPNLKGILITPISPHSLTQRPIVVPQDSEIEVKVVDRPGEAFLTLDGQDAVRLKENDRIAIRTLVKHKLLIVTSPTRDYYSLIREKFSFGSCA